MGEARLAGHGEEMAALDGHLSDRLTGRSYRRPWAGLSDLGGSRKWVCSGLDAVRKRVIWPLGVSV
jgi:hypothetical protein